MRRSAFVFLALASFLVAGLAGAGAADTDALVRSVLGGIGATVVECPAAQIPLARQRVCATYSPSLHQFRHAWNEYMATDRTIPARSGNDWVMDWSACCHRVYDYEDTGLRVTLDFNARLVNISFRESTSGMDAGSRPAVLKQTRVKYPKEAKKNRITGKVALDVVVRDDGTVKDVALDWACPQGYGLEQAAAEAVRQWRFEPTVRDGVPVQRSTNVVVEFRRNVTGKATQTASARPAPVMDLRVFD